MSDYIGIDPGANGAAFMQTIAGPRVYRMRAGDLRDLAGWIQMHVGLGPDNRTIAVLEQQHAMPVERVNQKTGKTIRQGSSSIFSLGQRYGEIIGILTALRVPYVVVSPAKWQNYFGIRGRGKGASRELAGALYPSLRIGRTDDGVSDAVLLAEYGRRTML